MKINPEVDTAVEHWALSAAFSFEFSTLLFHLVFCQL